MPQSLSDLLNLYNYSFKPAYADLVAYIGDKPVEAIVEIENAFSHLMIYLDDAEPDDIRQDNLQKAYNHLVRATLDCRKLLWKKIVEDVDEIAKNKDKRLTLALSEKEFITLKQKLREKSIQARRKEMDNIGKEPLEAIKLYEEAIEVGQEILKAVDEDKEVHLSFLKKVFTWHNIIVSVIGGLIASLLWMIWLKLFG